MVAPQTHFLISAVRALFAAPATERPSGRADGQRGGYGPARALDQPSSDPTSRGRRNKRVNSKP